MLVVMCMYVGQLFSDFRDYSCDRESIIALTLMYCGYAVVDLQQIAVELLQLLEQRFFEDEVKLLNFALLGLQGIHNTSSNQLDN